MTYQAHLADRSLFPDLEARAYTNHAAISPPSLAVIAAVESILRDNARRGVAAHMLWLEQREALRHTLERLVGAEPNSVALTANTTRGITDIALCIPWQRGDRVVLTRGEFPANITPWQRAAELFELEIVWLSAPRADTVENAWLDELRATLERGCRVVALSVVEFQTGLRLPLERIGGLVKEHGAELAVDAIQAAGVVPIDVQKCGVHYLSAGSHKWLMGLEGLAFVYAKPEAAERLRPHVAGWLSHDDALSFLFEGPGHLRHDRSITRGTRMFEGGMANAVGAAGLAASVGLILELGVETIFAHVDAYNDALDRSLAELGFVSQRAGSASLRSGSASFAPPAGVSVKDLYAHIDGTTVSCSTPDGLLRFSPHWPNSSDEVPLVVSEVGRALAQCR